MTYEPKKCWICEKLYQPKTGNSFYCSRECARIVRLTLMAARNKAARSKTGYWKYLGRACERCGSKSFLLVHHKDGNHYNDERINLETLCKSCHQSHHSRAS